MKTIRNHFWLLALAALAGPGLSHGDQTQLPVSRIRGLLPVTLAGGGTTMVGLPLIAEPVTTHLTITGVTQSTVSTTLTVAGTPLTSLDLTTQPHSVLIVSGGQNGVAERITAATPNSVTTARPLPAGIKTLLDRFVVVPNWTLTSGPHTLGLDTVLTGANDAASADKVTIEENGVSTQFYFHTGSGQWRQLPADTPPAGAVGVPLQRGIRIDRVAGVDEDWILNGVVNSGTQKVLRRAGQTVIFGNPFLTPYTLGNSGLRDLLTPAATGAAAIEKISLASAGTVTEYYLKNNGNFHAVVGDALANAVPVPAGAAVLVTGAPPTEPRTWPRRWRLGRPRRSLAPPAQQSGDRFWTALERFPTGA
jgi:hypothetical protein